MRVAGWSSAGADGRDQAIELEEWAFQTAYTQLESTRPDRMVNRPGCERRTIPSPEPWQTLWTDPDL